MKKMYVKPIKHPFMLNVNRYKEYKTFLNDLMKRSERHVNDEQIKANVHNLKIIMESDERYHQ